MVSRQAFDHKPVKDLKKGIDEVPKPNDFRLVYTDVEGMKDLISKGHTLRNRCNDDGPEDAYTVMVDIDHFRKGDPVSFIKTFPKQPTFAYTTPRDGLNGERRFRLIYVFDTPIGEKGDFTALYNAIIAENHLTDDMGLDPCGKTINQCFHGNGTGNIEWLHDGHICHVSDFDIEPYREPADDPKRKQRAKEAAKTDFPLDGCFLELLRNDRNFFIAEYSHLTAPTRSTGNLHHSGLFFTHDDGYYSIVRKWEKDENGKMTIHRWKDGEQRRKKLFVAARILLTVNPWMTNEELVYNLALELRHFYDNSTDTITTEELVYIASSASKSDWKPAQGKKTFSLNPLFNTEEPMTRQKRVALARRTLTDEKIGEIYDASLTPYGNFKVMKKMGMRVSWNTVKRFARENGLMEEFVTGPLSNLNITPPLPSILLDGTVTGNKIDGLMEEFVTGTFPQSNNIIETKHPYILAEGGKPGNKIEDFLKRGFRNVNEAWKTSQSEEIDLGMGRNAFREYCKQHHPELFDKSKIRNKKQ